MKSGSVSSKGVVLDIAGGVECSPEKLKPANPMAAWNSAGFSIGECMSSSISWLLGGVLNIGSEVRSTGLGEPCSNLSYLVP
jgi:hypothetical protein